MLDKNILNIFQSIENDPNIILKSTSRRKINTVSTKNEIKDFSNKIELFFFLDAFFFEFTFCVFIFSFYKEDNLWIIY